MAVLPIIVHATQSSYIPVLHGNSCKTDWQFRQEWPCAFCFCYKHFPLKQDGCLRHHDHVQTDITCTPYPRCWAGSLLLPDGNMLSSQVQPILSSLKLWWHFAMTKKLLLLSPGRHIFWSWTLVAGPPNPWYSHTIQKMTGWNDLVVFLSDLTLFGSVFLSHPAASPLFFSTKAWCTDVCLFSPVLLAHASDVILQCCKVAASATCRFWYAGPWAQNSEATLFWATGSVNKFTPCFQQRLVSSVPHTVPSLIENLTTWTFATDLAGWADTFEEAAKDDQPGQSQTPQQLPANLAHVLYAISLLQYVVAVPRDCSQVRTWKWRQLTPVWTAILQHNFYVIKLINLTLVEADPNNWKWLAISINFFGGLKLSTMSRSLSPACLLFSRSNDIHKILY